MGYIDETGNVYERLTVLRRATKEEKQIKSRAVQWVCQCSCGNTTIVAGTRLRNGEIKSCGCLQKERAGENLKQNLLDETNNRYGYLTVMYKVGTSKNRTAIWHCKCDCGKEVDVLGTHLRDGHTKSCGCLRNKTLRDISLGKMSNLEKIIYKIFVQNKMNFVREKVFQDLQRGLYRFDFYLPDDKICVEVNGEQHYHYTSFFYKKRSDFSKAQERDRQKIGYCLAKGIRLYCIPFWDVEGIKDLDGIFKKEYLATSKYHNDIAWREYKKKK